MEEHRVIRPETVAHLAEAAMLPLDPERVALIALQMEGLVAAANELSRKMARHRAVGPTIHFTHTARGRE